MIETKLRNVILPIYTELLSKVEEEGIDDVCTFCAQWGRNFENIDPNKRTLFVGKAVNGWRNNSKNIEELFGRGISQVFGRDDQMKWVHDMENSDIYNTKKSAFWRLIKKMSLQYYSSDWYNDIAWSNLFKIAPFDDGGNPNMNLRNIQRTLCWNILEKEIKILN